MIAQNLYSGKSNVVEIHTSSFNEQLDYEVLIKSKGFCSPPALVNVNSVFFCRSVAKLTFDLPCLDKGEYIMTIRDKNLPETIFLKQNAII